MRLLRFLQNNYTRIILLIIGCIAAFCSVSSYNREFNRTLKSIIQIKDESKLTLKVVSYPTLDNGKSKMICEVMECENRNLIGSKTRLTLKNPDAKEINYNDILKLSSTLKAADETPLPGAFDYREYLKSLDVTSQCYAQYQNIKITPGKSGLLSIVYTMRKNFIKSVDKYFSSEYGGLIKAVMTGDRTGIDEDISNSLKIAGVYHIVAISGLHLNIFICYITALFAGLRMKRFRKCILTYSVCMVCAVFVLIFTGYGVSVIRAFAMLAILFAANIFSRDYSSKNSLVLSAFIIIIFMPYNIYNTAFYLSFLSTFGVILSTDIIKHLKDREVLRSGAAASFTQVVITSFMTIILTLPVTMVSFGYIPLFSWLANLIILPVMAPLLGYTLIFAVVSSIGIEWLSALASYASHALTAVVIELSSFVANIPYATIDIYLKDVIIFAVLFCTAICTICILHRYGMRKAICAFLIFTVAFTMILKYNSISNKMTVHFVNVGQGDCALIETPGGNTALIDCGEQNGNKYLEGNIDSFLRNRNIKTIHTAFVTHFHADHTNGLMHLLETGKIRNLVLPAYYNSGEDEALSIKAELLRNAAVGHVNVYYMRSDTEASIDGVEFDVVAPDQNMFFDNNNMSAIIKLTYGENSFLFTGDIEEKAMLKCLNKDIDCDVMKVAHHGSKTGAVDDFYEKSSPEYAIISCGASNTYGHPAKPILDILDKRGITYYRTDTNGVITFTVNKEKILEIETMR